MPVDASLNALAFRRGNLCFQSIGFTDPFFFKYEIATPPFGRLAMTIFLRCHCEERSDEAILFFVFPEKEIAAPAFGRLAMTVNLIVIASSEATKQSRFKKLWLENVLAKPISVRLPCLPYGRLAMTEMEDCHRFCFAEAFKRG